MTSVNITVYIRRSWRIFVRCKAETDIYNSVQFCLAENTRVNTHIILFCHEKEKAISTF